MTRYEIIHKVAQAIDPMAFIPEADPHRFANAIIAAENAIHALAECDFPDEAIDDAEEARIEAIDAHRKHQAEVWANIGKPIPENARGTAAFTWMPPAFKALLRSIANEGKDNG